MNKIIILCKLLPSIEKESWNPNWHEKYKKGKLQANHSHEQMGKKIKIFPNQIQQSLKSRPLHKQVRFTPGYSSGLTHFLSALWKAVSLLTPAHDSCWKIHSRLFPTKDMCCFSQAACKMFSPCLHFSAVLLWPLWT